MVRVFRQITFKLDLFVSATQYFRSNLVFQRYELRASKKHEKLATLDILWESPPPQKFVRINQ